MQTHRKYTFSAEIWIEHEGKLLLGKGGAEILRAIEEESSFSKATKKLDLSFTYVWNYVRKIEEATGEPVVEARRGGKGGGGSTKLTAFGENLLHEYRRLEKYLNEILSNPENFRLTGLNNDAL